MQAGVFLWFVARQKKAALTTREKGRNAEEVVFTAGNN
jgi:hypothetical protein